MAERVPLPEKLPEPIEVRLLPYWAAVRQHRLAGDTLEPKHFWFFIISCPTVLNGKVASKLVASLPYHVVFKMQRNFGV